MNRSAPRTLPALLLLTAAACGDVPSTRAEAAAADPFCGRAMARVDSFMAAAPPVRAERTGGTAVVGGIAELVNGMNAFATIDYGAQQHQQFVNLMTLIRLNEALVPEPYLAESWTLSEDGRELTFTLRDDVYWHDGERTDAHDVAFTFLRATDPETAFPNAAFWDAYVPGPDGVEVLDDLTVTFRLEPHAEVLDPWRALAIMPEHLLGDVPPGELAAHPFGSVCPVGNGPFVFAAHRPRDRWVFEANPAFPPELGGPPRLDRLVYRVVPDQTTLLAELLTGALDVYLSLRPEQARTVVEDPDARLEVFDPREFTFVGWNTRRPGLADPRVRRAIAMAMDREAVVDALLRGYGIVAQTGVPPFHWGHDPELTGVEFDPEGARRLLDEAGWSDRNGDGVREGPDGSPLELILVYNAGNQDRQIIAELMQSELRGVGVSLTPEGLEPGQLAARVTDPALRDFDGVVLGWVAEFRVDEKDLFHSDRAGQPWGFAGLRDRELDALMDTLQLVRDRSEAVPLWHRYQRRIVELQPFLYLFYSQKLTGVSSRLRAVVMDSRGELVSVREWWIDSEGAQ